MQRITCMGPAAAPVLVWTAAPIADPSAITTAVAASTHPTSAAHPTTVANNNAARGIRDQILALAREIRKPRAWIGYIAFILFGLLKQCRPQVWEGSHKFCLLEQHAPWVLEMCTRQCAYAAISCGLRPNPDRSCGVASLVPISDEMPLNKMSHYVAGLSIPSGPSSDLVPEVKVEESEFSGFYRALGVHYWPTVSDGDCGVDVMCMIEGLERNLEERTKLRHMLSDYLIERMDEPWMIDILVASQELDGEEVKRAKSENNPPLPPPNRPPNAADGGELEQTPAKTAVAAIADIALEDCGELEPVTTEAMDAMRWASKLNDDCAVLALMRSLPNQVVQEQICRYNARETAVAARKLPNHKMSVGPFPTIRCKRAVAKRFDVFLEMRGVALAQRLPRGYMMTFVAENFCLTDGHKARPANAGSLQTYQNVRRWHRALVKDKPDGETAVAAKSLLKSRAKKQECQRRRAPGGGRQCKAAHCRQELYEWFSSIRYAVDWKAVIANNRSQGLKKNLARFPRAILRVKLMQLLREHAHASLLNGVPVQSIKPDSHWFARWQEDYGLSLRKANRRFSVPRHVLKERLQLFWVTLFRIRKLAVLTLGYEPLMLNFDQSPYHHNESGSQDKATLGVRGSTVPVVEGNCDVRSRWTANLTTCSDKTAVAAGSFHPAECMFKGARDGSVHKRLNEHRRQRGFPSWFTVSMSESGSYREHDVIAFLKRILEPMTEGRDWRIIFADDYRAHKTENVFHLCWERGYVLIVHGGGATPVAQTPDTDLNEDVRRLYGNREAALLMEKMRYGQIVPKLSHEECMDLMWGVLSDADLWQRAAQGYKKVGQSIDLHGSEDNQIVREAAKFWNEVTTDGFPNMRAKVDAEMADVLENYEAGHIKWNQYYVRRLINEYPIHRRIDNVLENLGDDNAHDCVHNLSDAEEDDGEESEAAVSEIDGETAVAADCENESAASSDNETAVAAVCEGPLKNDVATNKMEEDIVPLDATQADGVTQSQLQISALQASIEACRRTGLLKAVQSLELEISNLRRRQRKLSSETPVVAEAFKRQRLAEEQEFMEMQLRVRRDKDRRKEAQTAVAEKAAAQDELRKAKKAIRDMESKLACDAAMKTFSIEMFGAGHPKAGGQTARKNRFEVLDRLAGGNGAGAKLSPSQRNDFDWFKHNWDEAMVAEHKAQWAETFAHWMQGIVNSTEGNAFSIFMHSETNRVLRDKKALAVPGN